MEEIKFESLSKNIGQIFGLRYGLYHFENSQQWYLIDFGLHRIWLPFLGIFGPLFYRFIKIKTYAIEQAEIEKIKENHILQVITEVLDIIISWGLLSIIRWHRRTAIFKRKYEVNEYFLHHIGIFVITLIIVHILLSLILGSYHLSQCKKRDFIEIKLISRIKGKKYCTAILFRSILLWGIILLFINRIYLGYFAFWVYYTQLSLASPLVTELYKINVEVISSKKM